MKPLPPALRRPQNGRYSVEDAVRIWMHLWHGIEYDAPSTGRPYQLARRAAYGDLKPIIRSETVEAKPRITRRASAWLQPRGFAPDGWDLPAAPQPRPNRCVTRQWIDAADLIAIAAEHGIGLDVGDVKPAASAKPGPKPKNNEAVAYAERLIADGMQQTQAVMEAADQFSANKDTIERTIRRRRQRQ